MDQALATEPQDFRPELVDRRARLLSASRTRPHDAGLARLLGEVDAALSRLETGTYGLCETCHDPIEADRLACDPLLRFCIDHLSRKEQRALEEDLEAAARIQRALLPRLATDVAGWEIAYAFEPAGPVGGDCCDVLAHEGGEVTFVLGDVSGKGIPAAMLAASLQATIRSLAVPGLPVAALVERTNRIFRSSSVSRAFATLVCGRADAGGTLHVCNAGHCPPLLCTGEGVRELAPTGLPVGTFYSSDYGCHELQLSAGDFLLLYSDGLTEARDASSAEYGTERLAGVLGALRRPTAREVVDACLGDLHAHVEGGARSDDLTLLAVRRAAEPRT